MKPLTFNELSAEKSSRNAKGLERHKTVLLLNTSKLGLQYLAQVVDGGWITAKGSRKIGLPIELWNMIINSVAADTSHPNYVLVQPRKVSSSAHWYSLECVPIDLKFAESSPEGISAWRQICRTVTGVKQFEKFLRSPVHAPNPQVSLVQTENSQIAQLSHFNITKWDRYNILFRSLDTADIVAHSLGGDCGYCDSDRFVQRNDNYTPCPICMGRTFRKELKMLLAAMEGYHGDDEDDEENGRMFLLYTCGRLRELGYTVSRHLLLLEVFPCLTELVAQLPADVEEIIAGAVEEDYDSDYYDSEFGWGFCPTCGSACGYHSECDSECGCCSE